MVINWYFSKTSMLLVLSISYLNPSNDIIIVRTKILPLQLKIKFLLEREMQKNIRYCYNTNACHYNFFEIQTWSRRKTLIRYYYVNTVSLGNGFDQKNINRKSISDFRFLNEKKFNLNLFLIHLMWRRILHNIFFYAKWWNLYGNMLLGK